jgi:hypothetical protein
MQIKEKGLRLPMYIMQAERRKFIHSLDEANDDDY